MVGFTSYFAGTTSQRSHVKVSVTTIGFVSQSSENPVCLRCQKLLRSSFLLCKWPPNWAGSKNQPPAKKQKGAPAASNAPPSPSAQGRECSRNIALKMKTKISGSRLRYVTLRWGFDARMTMSCEPRVDFAARIRPKVVSGFGLRSHRHLESDSCRVGVWWFSEWPLACLMVYYHQAVRRSHTSLRIIYWLILNN